MTARTRWWALTAVSLATLMCYLDNNVVNVALPTIEHSLHLSVSGLEWIVSSYLLVLGGLLLVGGRVADVFGRRRIFLAGLVIFTLSSLIAGLAGSGGVLIAARAVHDARQALEWADLIYAMDLNGMNSSITPLSTVVQRDRPFTWLNWDAARVRDMIKGSYLFGDDPHRIIQDPESLRASSIRQGSAWQDWAALRDAVVLQVNSSDHNPAVHADLSPQDSWELSTPQLMKYYVKGGKNSNGKHGYIVSNANWDPYPMANKLEEFVIALANMDIAVSLRVDRFFNPFFTMADPAQVLHIGPGNGFAVYLAGGGGFTPVDLEQEIQSLTNPIAPSGQAIVATVEDLQAQTRIKAYRARQAVSTTFDLLGQDLLTATLWLDVRKAQDPARNFGAAPTAAWTAFRKVVPTLPTMEGVPSQSRPMAASAFLRSTPAANFYMGAPMPRSAESPSE